MLCRTLFKFSGGSCRTCPHCCVYHWLSLGESQRGETIRWLVTLTSWLPWRRDSLCSTWPSWNMSTPTSAASSLERLARVPVVLETAASVTGLLDMPHWKGFSRYSSKLTSFHCYFVPRCDVSVTPTDFTLSFDYEEKMNPPPDWWYESLWEVIRKARFNLRLGHMAKK